jgi:hypothetical protein
MNFVDAVATGRPLHRPGVTMRAQQDSFLPTNSPTYIQGPMDPNYMLGAVQLTRTDILATDWVVEPLPPQVLSLTARQIEQSYYRWNSLGGMLKGLGFNPGEYDGGEG